MAEFKRKENFAIVQIGRDEYKVEPIAGNRMISEYNNKAPELLKRIGESGYDEGEVKVFMDFIVSIIDEVLCEKACETIFDGECSYYDLVDLYVCIRDAVTEFNKSKIEEYATV